MPLFNDLAGRSVTCFADMVEIVRCDGGFGSAVVPGDPSVARFTYTRNLSGTSQQRISALIGVGVNIVVGAVGPGFVLPNGTPITAVAGATLFPDINGVIRIFYDVDSTYFVIGLGGGQISFPREVCLYHELSHAFHIANGTLNAANPEFQAQTEENGFRTQTGLALRDPNNHNGGLGVGNGQRLPSCSGAGSGEGEGNSSCFIASAAAGSPAAPQVVKLKSARDAFMATSPIFGAIALRTLGEYYGFSSVVAEDMRRKPELREAVNAWFVEPLSRFDAIADAFSNHNGEAGDFVDAVEHLINDAHGRDAMVGEVADAAVVLAERLEHGENAIPAPPPDETSPALVFSYVGDRALSVGPVPGLAWMSRALALYWRLAADGLTAGTEGRRCLAEQVEEWIASAPVPCEVFHLSASAFEADLKWLGATVLRSGGVRARVVNRTLAAAQAAHLEREDLDRLTQSFVRAGFPVPKK